MDTDYSAEAARILSNLARRTVMECRHGDRATFCLRELEGEVASLLRQIAEAK